MYPQTIAPGTKPSGLIPNTQDALGFSPSPDGQRIAFTAVAGALTLPHVFMVNRDGTGCRQVTDSKKSSEKSVVFSPEGDSLLVPTVEGCNDLISFGRAPDLVHKAPADATLADVTQETSIYVLRVRSADQNRFALAFRTHHMKT